MVLSAHSGAVVSVHGPQDRGAWWQETSPLVHVLSPTERADQALEALRAELEQAIEHERWRIQTHPVWVQGKHSNGLVLMPGTGAEAESIDEVAGILARHPAVLVEVVVALPPSGRREDAGEVGMALARQVASGGVSHDRLVVVLEASPPVPAPPLQPVLYLLPRW